VTAEALAKHPLWHAVGIGTQPYARLAFRIETHGAGGFRFHRGLLIVVTHRAETDAPILIAELYRRARVWANRSDRLHFAARDDLFERGFFAGFPPRLPSTARRALFPLGIGRFLPMTRVHPIGSGSKMKLAQALSRVDPRTPLPRVLAERFGAARPRTAGEALRGEHAAVLWRDVDSDSCPLPEAWAVRAAEARRQVETLVELMRAGEPLLIFPEGRPSPDGSVGPLQRGIRLLVRRGRPEQMSPWAIGYDPLVRGRTRAVVSVRPLVAPDPQRVEEQVLAELKLAMPVTAATAVAHALRAGEEPAAVLGAAVEQAYAEGRNVERELGTAEGRRRRLAECLDAVSGTRDDRLLDRLAREFASAREP
jgi:1-acyl-sn-glycerol-3-phosphate acyltransferase